MTVPELTVSVLENDTEKVFEKIEDGIIRLPNLEISRSHPSPFLLLRAADLRHVDGAMMPAFPFQNVENQNTTKAIRHDISGGAI